MRIFTLLLVGMLTLFAQCEKKNLEGPAGIVDNRPAAELFAEAKKLYDAKEYAKCAPLMTAAAEKGNADAQMHLGKMYFNGRGVVHDHAKGKYWHEKAAAQGNQESIEKLKKMEH